MDIALTLVVNPDSDTLLNEAENIVIKTLQTGEVISTASLDDNVASDIFIAGNSLAAIHAELASTLNAIEGLDWAVQANKGRKKKLILADMDSTIITVECIDELADFVGLKAQVSEITEAAMRGELDFEGALTERVSLLKGLTEQQLKSCYDERVTLMGGARTLVQTMKANGAYAALVSGGFTYFTDKVADAVGFDTHRSNILELKDGVLTGCVVPPICGAQTKLDTLNELSARLLVPQSGILSVGDGANDIPMINGAGLGVAYHAKPKTAAAADAAIKYGDLTTLLYFQGYKKSEFATG